MTPRGLAIIAILFALPLAACDEAVEEPQGKVVSIDHPRDLPSWLTVKDTIEPSLWLRSRELGRFVLPSDPEVDRIRRAMHQTEARFFEDDRMVANRTAQTAEMLAEAKQPERIVDIMTGMVDVADVSAHKQLYGEMCQQYLNIRKLGVDRTAALDRLRAAYKIQNSLR